MSKAKGVSTALFELLKDDGIEEMVQTGMKTAPLLPNTVFATMENAGVKFKTRAQTGQAYLKQLEAMIRDILKKMPTIRCMAVIEEKYGYTPDDFKAQTRAKRGPKKDDTSVVHLKAAEEVMSLGEMSRTAVISTTLGKKLISNFLAPFASTLSLKNVTLIIDSEYKMGGCTCASHLKGICKCKTYAVPLQVDFDCDGKATMQELNVQQRKGEGEMAQVDWLRENLELKDGEDVTSYLTSGDIDAVAIHMFSLSIHWPRAPDGKFINQVNILLRKPNTYDLYNITKVIEVIEAKYGKYSAMTVAIILCMGGNDYLPKVRGISHLKLLQEVINREKLATLIHFEGNQFCFTKGYIDEETYIYVMKCFFCPKSYDPSKLSFDEVRQLSVRLPGKEVRSRDNWMPHLSALRQVIKLINSQISYFSRLLTIQLISLTLWKMVA